MQTKRKRKKTNNFEQKVEDAIRSNNLLPSTAKSIIRAMRGLKTRRLLSLEDLKL